MATRKGPTKGRTSTKSKQSRRGPRTAAEKPRRPASATPPAPPPTHPRLASQAQTFRESGPPLPENFHALYDRGFRAARGVTPAAVTPQETAGHQRLAHHVRGLLVHYDPATQLPNLVTTEQPQTPLSRAAPGTPERAAMEFIQDQSDLWNLSSDDTGTVEVVSVSQPRGEAPPRGARAPRRAAAAEPEFSIANLKTVNMIQRVDGREVFNSDVTAAVDTNNQVLSVAGQFFPGASRSSARARGVAPQPPFTPEVEAISRAAFDLTSVVYNATDFSPVASPGDTSPYRLYEFNQPPNDPRPRLERPVRLKDVMFPLGEGQFVPAYYIELWINGFPAFSYVLDAIDTPDVLYRKNLTSHVKFNYRVHNTGDAISRPEDGPAPGTPHPTGKPNGFQAQPVPEQLIEIESLLPGDPWLPPKSTTTEGNNCIAYADLESPNGFSGGDVVGKVTAPRTFDYTYDHTKSASDRRGTCRTASSECSST